MTNINLNSLMQNLQGARIQRAVVEHGSSCGPERKVGGRQILRDLRKASVRQGRHPLRKGRVRRKGRRPGLRDEPAQRFAVHFQQL